MTDSHFELLWSLNATWSVGVFGTLYVRARRRDAERDAGRPRQDEAIVEWTGGARTKRGLLSAHASWPLVVLEAYADCVHIYGRGPTTVFIPSTWYDRSDTARVVVKRGLIGREVMFIPATEGYTTKFTVSRWQAAAIGQYLLDNGWPVEQ